MECAAIPCVKGLQLATAACYMPHSYSYINACMMLIKLVGIAIYACMLHDQQDATCSNYNYIASIRVAVAMHACSYSGFIRAIAITHV